MNELMTKWGRKLNPNQILQEYPRPQLVRDSYINLNGKWDYAISKTKEITSYDGEILVPFAPESKLSGVRKTVQPDDVLHYRRGFKVPFNFMDGRVLLHFGAVDQECEVFLNGQKVGEHQGGYLPFHFDVTDAIVHEQENILKVQVTDETEYSPHARGKQKLHHKGKMDAIFYTASSGIWKTVWLESVSHDYIQTIRTTPNYDAGSVTFYVETNTDAGDVNLEISFEDEVVKEVTIAPNEDVEVELGKFKSWSPESPHLYNVSIQYGKDRVTSYFAMRKYSKEKDKNGVYRFHLNNKPYYFNGLLDQGYWPESLLTAPSDDALKFDILETKKLGFNTIRKHVKIEPERFYAHCDRIGMLVLQDMPNGGDDIIKPFVMYLPNISDRVSRKIGDHHYKIFGRTDAEGRKQYREDLEKMVTTLYNYPSIAMWIPFNEGWGQFDANQAMAQVRALDSTRLVIETSGWFDQGGGDVYTIHNYFKQLKIKPQPDRLVAVTEYGGYALPVKDHLPAQKEFGYKSYGSAAELETNYRKLWEKQILPQIASGLSGTIYTQTTDIEEEINGLFTYNREVLKMNPAVIQSLNNALYHVFESITHK